MAKRYTEVLGQKYILIRAKTLIPVVLADIVGGALTGVFHRLRPGRGSTLPRNEEVRKILVIRLDHIGDVLLTTPALSALRELYPRARITCLVGSWASEVLEGNPDVDEILTFDASWYKSFNTTSINWRGCLSLVRRLRKVGFDMAVDFRGDFRHLLLARLIGAKRRVGYGIRGGGFLLTEKVPYDENAHEVEKNLDLVRHLGGRKRFSNLALSLPPEDLRYADSVFAGLRLGPDSIVVGLCPCSRNRSRWWHARGFTEVCRYLTETLKAHVLIFGDRSCAGFVVEIVTPLGSRRVTSLVGKTSLRQFAACLKRVDFIVSIESSPIHFASAIGKPIVVLFGGTSLPETWGPYHVPHKIVKAEVECAPCFQLICPLDEVRCMEAITPGDVIEACSSLVEELARMDPELGRKLKQWPSSP